MPLNFAAVVKVADQIIAEDIMVIQANVSLQYHENMRLDENL